MTSQRYPQTFSLSLSIIIFTVLLRNSSQLQFTVLLTPHQRFCFYQILQHQQKYTFVTNSPQSNPQQVQVSYIDSNTRVWKSVYYRSTLSHESTVRVDKLAQLSTTYSFCIKSLASSDQRYKLQFGQGLDVQEFHTLPDKTDDQNLDREINWIEKQALNLANKSENIQGLRRINQQISGMVGIQMIVFAILGIAVIGAVNVIFFWLVKGELKRRKLI